MLQKTHKLNYKTVYDIISESWAEIKECIEEIDNAYKPDPEGFDEIFNVKPVDGYVTDVEISPIIFFLPESYSSEKNDLIFAIKGKISFVNISTSNKNPCLQTKRFETKVEVFRQVNEKNNPVLKHSFGVLYHFDCENFDHPKFHAHITKEFDDEIYEKIEDVLIEISPSSNLKGIVGKIRIPTAQMDVFSVIVQLCADHMITSRDITLKPSFVKLKDACNFFQSAENNFNKQIQTLNSPICLRSMHWYEN